MSAGNHVYPITKVLEGGWTYMGLGVYESRTSPEVPYICKFFSLTTYGPTV